ncbi:MAG TPA: ABC transporter ATP-binding protein [Candidatus Saccharimonadia bacterium]|nr:ABC transporter ATP-binding protein [Candidatus Saccharimonadia bacterium]
MNDEKPRTTPAPPPVRLGFGGRPGGAMSGGMGAPVEKPRDFKATMKNLLAYIKPFWVSIIFVIIFAVASTVFAVISPKILGTMTNQVVSDYERQAAFGQIKAQLPKGVTLPPHTTGAQFLKEAPPALVAKIPSAFRGTIDSLDLSVRPVMHFEILRRIAYMLIVLYLLSAIFSYAQGWIMTSVTQKVTYRFRQDISTKINRLPLKYFDSRTYGEVLSRVTNDVDTVSQTLNQSLTQIVTSVTMIIGILIMMLSINVLLTLVSVIILPISFVLIAVIVKRSQRYFKLQQDSLGHINGHIEEMYAGHNVMRVFNGKERSIAKFTKINDDLYDSAWKAQFLSGLMMPLMTFVGNLSTVAISVLGGWLAVNGKINIGDIQAFIQYANQFNQPIIQTANIANVLQSTAASAERVFEFLAEPEETKEAAAPATLTKVKGAVTFDNIVFGYSPEVKIIKNFNALAKPGQRIAIVGPTGAGKTTIVNLLMRFYDVTSGAIRVDGVDVRDMKRADVHRLFGMVLQDTWLFNGTIRDNIKYGKPDATEADMLRAAKAAHVDEFVKTLPGGYNLVLNEEANNISQGQKQLLTIARAMLADTPMLILDEATSSVDTRTEILIQRAMERLMKNKTSFVIAHRLSTIRDADLILVMNNGNIVEQGTHDELLGKNGFYASLYASQFTGPAVAATELVPA